MHLRYDEDWVEAVVFLCASGRRTGVPSMQLARFHRQREKLYTILDADARNAAFFALHLEWFREWGLETLLTGVLDKFTLLPAALGILAFRQAHGRNEEGAELYVNEAGKRSGVVALRAARFEHDAAVTGFLRHELTHLQDMVDPAFGYSPELQAPGANPAGQRVVRERYRLLWDITIDGRLAAAGHGPSGARDQHWSAFARGYCFWPEQKQAEVFDSLWQGRSVGHAALMELASDPRGLREAHQPVPGAPCPLCGFATFDWVEEGGVAPEVIAAINDEFPAWSSDQGVCGRCHEIYLLAGAARRMAVR